MYRPKCQNVALIVLMVTCLASGVYTRMTIRQSAAAATGTALSTKTSTGLMQSVVLPALRTMVHTPIKMIQQFLTDLRALIQNHSMGDVFDVRLVNQLVTKLPLRLTAYWQTFQTVEMECITRTLCDLSEYTSPRIPSWLHQILVIYFTTFSQGNVYYQSLANGMINHNCAAFYAECDPSSFFTRISSNVTASVNSTMAPLKDALHELAQVTMTTLRSFSVTPPPPPMPAQIHHQLEDSNEIGHEQPMDEPLPERRPNSASKGFFFRNQNEPNVPVVAQPALVRFHPHPQPALMNPVGSG